MRQTPVLQARCLLDAFVFGALGSSSRLLRRESCAVRPDWDTNSTHPLEFRDSRAAVAALVVDLQWVESFSYRFQHPQHINLLELEALISLIRVQVDRGLGNRRVLCLLSAELFLDQCARNVQAVDV